MSREKEEGGGGDAAGGIECAEAREPQGAWACVGGMTVRRRLRAQRLQGTLGSDGGWGRGAVCPTWAAALYHPGHYLSL